MNTVRVAVAGCGNVSRGSYLPHLRGSRHVRIVAVADVNPEAARKAGKECGGVPAFTDARRMLAAVPSDLFVILTSMPEHGPLSLLGLRAGRHVWCEKPMATDLATARAILHEAKRRRLVFRAAPVVTLSPAYAALKRLVDSGRLGTVCQLRARYGHGGQGMWSGWFFKKGGGSLFDLGVYNVTTLTGLMGPAKAVSAMAGVAVPIRRLADGSRVRGTVEDNAILTLDFGRARYGVVQSGFTIAKVDGGAGHVGDASSSSIEVIGTKGTARMKGYDWAPGGLEVGLVGKKGWSTVARDQRGYHWAGGATHLAECLATGRKPVPSASHAFHVLEIMLAAHRSARTGRRIPIRSTFGPR